MTFTDFLAATPTDDALGLYPLGWMYDRMLPESARDADGEPVRHIESAMTRVHGTGTFAAFMRVDAIPTAFVAEAA